MEIKATLNKPYSDKQRMDFIVEYNHNLGYKIEEIETELQAWDFDDEEKQEQRKQQMRAVRNQYLSDTDKYMITDFPVSKTEKANYKLYRQYLRDYTEQENWWIAKPLTFEEWKSEQ